MRFKNRAEAGKLLAKKLGKYKSKTVIVYALPRGGVVTAYEVAKHLHAPLELVIARKIAHPASSEYAIAAMAENGHIVGSGHELLSVSQDWLKDEIEKQRKEATRRRKVYLKGKKMISCEGKIAILIDDGVATGLTLRVGIIELKHNNPQKIIVAVPVIPQSIAAVLASEASEVVAFSTPSDDQFLGAVGSYYVDFPQISDEEVIRLLRSYEQEFERERQKADVFKKEVTTI